MDVAVEMAVVLRLGPCRVVVRFGALGGAGVVSVLAPLVVPLLLTVAADVAIAVAVELSVADAVAAAVDDADDVAVDVAVVLSAGTPHVRFPCVPVALNSSQFNFAACLAQLANLARLPPPRKWLLSHWMSDASTCVVAVLVCVVDGVVVAVVVAVVGEAQAPLSP